jgi:hypothetical protein
MPLAATPVAQAVATSHESARDEYRKHLSNLNALVESCAKARDTKSCDPALVGPDDHVPVANSGGTERRLIRYGWLRVLLSSRPPA